MRRNEAIFQVKIDYPYDAKQKGARLTETDSNPNFEDRRSLPSYRRAQEIASRAILKELPEDIAEIYDINIKTRIVAEREGSLVIYFGAAVTAYTLIGGYASFFNSLELIREHAVYLLEKAFLKEFPDRMDISISRQTHRSDGRLFRMKEMELFFDEYASSELPHNRQKRGWMIGRGFFLYLLIMNIALLAIVGVISYQAIKAVYFP